MLQTHHYQSVIENKYYINKDENISLLAKSKCLNEFFITFVGNNILKFGKSLISICVLCV